MKTLLKQLNLSYLRDCDGDEWLFIPVKDGEYLTSHNGCACLSDKDSNDPYFARFGGNVMEDCEVDFIRPANDEEIDWFVKIIEQHNLRFNDKNKLKKIK